MCFSAEVSFTLSGALLIGGAYCTRKALRVDKALLPIAVIPVVFGVQQFCEGWVWTGLERAQPSVVAIAATAFLFFALCFWPIWIPFSMLLAERSGKTRWFLRAMTALGALIGLGLMMPIAIDHTWLAVDVYGDSLHYNISRSPIFNSIPNVVWQVLYFVVVATPLFVSSLRKMVHFGVALIVSAAATHVFFDHTFASVWCFFSAALSLYLCGVFYRFSAPPAPPRLGELDATPARSDR